MAQFDVYRISGEPRLFLSVQHDILDERSTIVVVPLQPVEDSPIPITRLNPVFSKGGKSYQLLTTALAAVPTPILEHTGLNLSDERDKIISALDFLFTGF